MVYGVIEEKAEKFYTYLPKIFDAIGNGYFLEPVRA